MMHRVFGKAKAPSPPASLTPPVVTAMSDPVLTEIAESREIVEKRRDYLTNKAHKETANAIEHKAHGRKDQALACLKRKKMIDTEIDGLVQQLLRIDSQEHTLSALKFTKHTMELEKRATDAIKTEMAIIGSIDALDEQRAATTETLEDAYEMLGVAGSKFEVPGVDQDDDELLEELERIAEDDAQARLEAQLLAVPDAPVPLPVPVGLRKKQEQEAQELAEIDALAAQMRVDLPMPSLGSSADMVIEVA